MSNNIKVAIANQEDEDFSKVGEDEEEMRSSSGVSEGYSEDDFDADVETGSEDNRKESNGGGGAMSLFMLGRTYRWVSRAKVAAWFRQAFAGGGGGSETPKPKLKTPGSKRSPSIFKMREMRNLALDDQKRPKVFYHLTPRQPGHTLTLEQNINSMFRADSVDSGDVEIEVSNEEEEEKKPRVKPTKVTKWMRRASGVFEDEYIEQLHAKLIEDAKKVVQNEEEEGKNTLQV